MKTDEPNKAAQSNSWDGMGVALGIALGTALGAAWDNVGLGIALGVAFGAALDSSAACWKRAQSNSVDESL